jgi:hypothetical protein
MLVGQRVRIQCWSHCQVGLIRKNVWNAHNEINQIVKIENFQVGSPAWIRTTIRATHAECVSCRVLIGLKCHVGPEKPALVRDSYTESSPRARICRMIQQAPLACTQADHNLTGTSRCVVPPFVRSLRLRAHLRMRQFLIPTVHRVSSEVRTRFLSPPPKAQAKQTA